MLQYDFPKPYSDLSVSFLYIQDPLYANTTTKRIASLLWDFLLCILKMDPQNDKSHVVVLFCTTLFFETNDSSAQ